MKFTFAPESRPLEGFTIKRAIYRGGFGEVYYAVSDAGREVALKLLQNNADVELRGVQQCLNLSHPNLVTIFDVRQDGDGDHWIIMEYVAGETLDSLLRRSSKGLPVETVRRWIHGMTQGLSYLHSRGLVHRDMKPANVFMENGTVKIGDVGLSKYISPSRHSAQTQSVGTVHYMAPEVAKGTYGREVDIYALGVVLYEMLTGEPPFDGESTGEILMKHLSEQPDLSKLPPRLRGVLAKALEKDPKQRYSRVEALQRAFDDAVLGIGQASTAIDETAIYDTDSSADNKVNRSVKNETVGRVQLPDTSQRTPAYECGNDSKQGWLKGFPLGGIVVSLLVFLLVAPKSGERISWMIIFVIGAIISYGIVKSRRFMEETRERNQALLRRGPGRDADRAESPKRLRRGPDYGSLFSSLVLTVPTALILVSCLVLIKPSVLGGATGLTSLDLGATALFLLVTLLGSWAVLTLSLLKATGQKRKKIPAYIFALLGAGVGVTAFGLDQYLMVEAIGPARGGIFSSIGDHVLYMDQQPTLGGYIAFFASFFALRNWQEMVLPFRRHRFSIGSVLITVFSAWLATTIFQFPGEIAVAWGVLISCVVQLSAPVSPPQRRAHAIRLNG